MGEVIDLFEYHQMQNILIHPSGKKVAINPPPGGYTRQLLMSYVGGPLEIIEFQDGRKMIANERCLLDKLPVNHHAMSLCGPSVFVGGTVVVI
jgi:hypothetical protein